MRAEGDGGRTCTLCGEWKEFSAFHRNKGHKYGRCAHCAICGNIKSKQYRESRGEKGKKEVRLYNQKYREENKESLRKKKKEWFNSPEVVARRKEYRRTHKEEIRLKKKAIRSTQAYKDVRNAGRRAKRKRDPIWKSHAYIQTRIKVAVNRQSVSKKGRTFDLLGASGEETFNYLTAMGYDPDAHHVDHIIPCSRFDLSQESHQRVCFNYRNLQPLLPTDNLKKFNHLPNNWQQLLQEICDALQIPLISINTGKWQRYWRVDNPFKDECNEYR